MRIAYLILVHEAPELFRLLITELLKDEKAAVYVHVDKRSKKAEFAFDSPRVIFLKKRIDVKWGGISMVDATLELIREARKGDPDYYCLLSGRDYVLRSPLAFRRKLESLYPKGLLEGTFITDRWTEKGYDRINYYFLYRFKNRKLANLQNRIARKLGRKLGIHRPFHQGMEPYCGSQWWTLSRPLIDFTLDYIKTHPEYYRFYVWAAMSDEQFFQTLLINLQPEMIVNRSQTLVKWENKMAHVFSLKDRNLLRTDPCHYFFRKCPVDDPDFTAFLRKQSDENKYLSMDQE